MRILQAPSNVCNISWAMAEGLRARGHHVEVWNHGESPNNFSVDRVFDVNQTPESYINCFMEAVAADFDVFHFHGTRSLIPARGPLPDMWDLPMLKAMGKKLIFTFHGSDVRLRSKDIADPWSFHNFANIPCDEALISHRLSIISAYADHLMVGNVLNLAYVAGSTYLPKPINLIDYKYRGIRQTNVPVVLHATRKRETKGTDTIIAALEDLSASGLQFDFRLVEGATHQETIDAIADADIIIEKVLSGDAGVLALEALAMGKVVVSRIRDEVYARHPDMPIINANPDTVKTVMHSLLSDQQRRNEVALKGRSYIEKNHSPDVIAEALEAIYSAPPKKYQTRDVWPRKKPISRVLRELLLSAYKKVIRF